MSTNEEEEVPVPMDPSSPRPRRGSDFPHVFEGADEIARAQTQAPRAHTPIPRSEGSATSSQEDPGSHLPGPAVPSGPADLPQPPEALWQAALDELSMTLQRSTFDTWLRDTAVLAYEDGEFIIGTPSPYARDWLQTRLRPRIKEVLARMARRTVDVRFCVKPPLAQAPSPDELPPLYRLASEPSPTAQDTAGPPPSPARSRPGPGWRPSEPPTPAPEAPQVTVDQILAAALHHRFTFQTFVVGSHNRLAAAAALAVVDNPGGEYNPLFIYGGVGLGKTHLLHAIGHEILKRGMRVYYCSAEQFANELIAAIRDQSTQAFRNKYRQVDLLLIDDIQFIAGKERTQEEFFHTFNHLHAAGRQVVITSDRPPKEIATLEARLRSRFEGGLLTDISQPDLETRVAILQSKAEVLGVQISQEILMFIAERIDSNIRELEGALKRVAMQARLFRGPITLEMIASILDDLAPRRQPQEPRQVLELVAAHFGVPVAVLKGRGRTKEVAHARQVAMYLLRTENDLSLPAIGDLLGGRDHSTIRHGVDKIAQELDRDEALRRQIQALREKIYAPSPG